MVGGGIEGQEGGDVHVDGLGHAEGDQESQKYSFFARGDLFFFGGVVMGVLVLEVSIFYKD